jgi:hypothetical protein
MKSEDASFPYTNLASVPTTHSYNMDEFGEKGIRGEPRKIFGRKRAVSIPSLYLPSLVRTAFHFFYLFLGY